MSCNHPKPVTRRQALALMGGGFGLVALSNMLNASLAQQALRAGPEAFSRNCISSRGRSASSFCS